MVMRSKMGAGDIVCVLLFISSTKNYQQLK
jgi:hypothetical protein